MSTVAIDHSARGWTLVAISTSGSDVRGTVLPSPGSVTGTSATTGWQSEQKMLRSDSGRPALLRVWVGLAARATGSILGAVAASVRNLPST